METWIIRNATLVNEGRQYTADVLIRNGRIEKIAAEISSEGRYRELAADGKWLLPGIIDDQVHFREPGLTHKATIATESRAAVAGGVTSFMEMPNTKPPTLSQALLEEKYNIAADNSPANFSFFMGASNDNIEEVLKTDGRRVCGVKVFMGSSTGNMLVDDKTVLETLFSRCPLLIATHCEDEDTIRTATERLLAEYGEGATASIHPMVRSAEACFLSSSMAVDLARRHGTRLHILHISTGMETVLFTNDVPLREKKITAEACVHHLSFDSRDYTRLGNLIKCNPAIKSPEDREQIWTALLDDRIDIIATDHAPHTIAEKSQPYFDAPSGLPLVQHSLYLMLRHLYAGRISLERIVEKMCHAPAVCFRIVDRGFIRESYWADLVLVDPEPEWQVSAGNILYKSGWSPLEGDTFKGQVTHTFVSGQLAYERGTIQHSVTGRRLEFDIDG